MSVCYTAFMKYVKNYCQETLEKPEWGFSTWYFELDDNNLPERQVVVYDHGPVQKHDRTHDELSHIPIDITEKSGYTFTDITSDDFEQLWRSAQFEVIE